ncbi:hypothetical protein FH972_021902 [Carpinus fangiana]|uniref:Uncharacterized protein n=1 Tax=Carpinus fangiana TaxID=176857 RepID=A0A5N6KQN1_9ROSI|nr:hypothetical protein FH972_021902 [Carpinus fangiana]
MPVLGADRRQWHIFSRSPTPKGWQPCAKSQCLRKGPGLAGTTVRVAVWICWKRADVDQQQVCPEGQCEVVPTEAARFIFSSATRDVDSAFRPFPSQPASSEDPSFRAPGTRLGRSAVPQPHARATVAPNHLRFSPNHFFRRPVRDRAALSRRCAPDPPRNLRQA